MLGWALKKGFQGATGLRDAPQGGEDTTQIDAPDTPAPVFAARALKNVLWGHSTAVEDPFPTKTKPTDHERVKSVAANTNDTGKAVPIDTRSPTKLNSILLTPGTGASRRKRVSFGRDVKAGNNPDVSPLASSSNRSTRQRRKTALQQALENSRPVKSKTPEKQEKEPEPANTDEESEWEDDEVFCNHDLTVDLNEPHSESGKYWKAQWAQYREEAKSDIEQLVKYKANTKTYAAKKDREASQLGQKLKEEQAKVAQLEKKIADMEASNKLKHDRVSSLRIDTSPRTEQSLHEVSRELRKARNDLRQMDRLREEVKRLKSHLAKSRERAAEFEVQASSVDVVESTRIARLEKQLRETKEDFRRKDKELKRVKGDYESLKRDAKSRTAEAMQVLQLKNEKIAELEKQLKAAEAANASIRQGSLYPTTADQNTITRDLKSNIESLGKLPKYDRARPINRHRRAASVEDITLDLTQRSLLTDKSDFTLDTPHRTGDYGGDVLDERTDDIPTFDLETKGATRHEKLPKLDENAIFEDRATRPARRTARRAEQTLPSERIAPDALVDRTNGGTERAQGSRSTNYDDLPTEPYQNRAGQRDSTRTIILAGNRATVRDARDRPVRPPRSTSTKNMTLSSANDAPAPDLVQDQFMPLEVPSSTDRSVLENTSRCALPAERLASARARLAQKREKRKASRQDFDKENVRP